MAVKLLTNMVGIERIPMFRIKTTTKNKAVFLSPFVFTDDQAEKKIKSISKWHTKWGWPKFEILPIKKYPKHTIWKKNHQYFGLLIKKRSRIV